MIDTITQPPDDVAAVRAKMLDDLTSTKVYAEAIGKSLRVVQRMIARGQLPTVTIGRTTYVVLSRARDALMSAPTIRHPPVRRGRPRKAA